MPKIKYEDINFSPEKEARIKQANSIIHEYSLQGFQLTLRQLYYQLVARGYIPNNDKEYNRLGDLVSDARMAGRIDWLHIVDRTRNVMENQHWEKPSEIIDQNCRAYAIDKWANQAHYVEAWVEKDALKDVVAHACIPLDIPYFSCRGYTSVSELWVASQRLIKAIKAGKTVHIIHLGDHDPSGIDMSRNIKDRMCQLTGTPVHVLRVALNMPQITRYQPPPNPAKSTDCRYQSYLKKYGDESWELDALEPRVIVDIIRRAVDQYRDPAKWKESAEREAKGRKTLKAIVNNFPSVVQHLKDLRNGAPDSPQEEPSAYRRYGDPPPPIVLK